MKLKDPKNFGDWLWIVICICIVGVILSFE